MSSESVTSNKRIAKNTIALYFRTLLTMLVGLYTGRVMLQALGVENYGINAVVGGLVAMSTLLTATISQAISRFLTYALGEGDKQNLRVIFSTSVSVQIVMAVSVAVVFEIVGLWFLNVQANIPSERMEAANWVLHFSILGLMVSLLSSPFNALIIAHERMSVYAYVGIADSVLKLMVCFAIMAYGGDRLMLLAVLQFMVTLLLQSFYSRYCVRHFVEARYSPRVFDKNLLKKITVFSGWTLMSNGAYVLSTQGLTMLLNVFFGVVFNASRSIAMTVNGIVQAFVTNFTMAFAPQITKSYASGNVDYAVSLVKRGNKLVWFLYFIFIVPACMEADLLLKLWLGTVPPYTPLFLRLALFETLISSVGYNFTRLYQADGRLKNYSIYCSLTQGLIFPLAWLAYYLGAPVWSAYVVCIVVYCLLLFVQIYHVRKIVVFSARGYVKDCLWPCILVSLSSFIVPVLLAQVMDQGLLRFIVMILVSVLWTSCCCYLLGMTDAERQFVRSQASSFRAKLLKRL